MPACGRGDGLTLSNMKLKASFTAICQNERDTYSTCTCKKKGIATVAVAV